MSAPYSHIHVVINPASGKDEPILNTLNDVFHEYGVDWDVSITKKYGDARAQAAAAIANGTDLIVGYGGDGTQHEIANAVISAQAVMGTSKPMGILPGGTGNGFANEMGIPKTLREAAVILCTSPKLRQVDAVRLGDECFIQRLYVGIEPEEQTSREQKDKYGVFAYAVAGYHRIRHLPEVPYHLIIDGEQIEVMGTKCYVVNSGQTGTGLNISTKFDISDGLLDVFMLDKHSLGTAVAAAERFLNLDTERANMFYWRGREITIETEPDQPVWTDGEYVGRTPVTATVLPGALSIVVP